jgi:P4 family phage/plasmid primase-like protien
MTNSTQPSLQSNPELRPATITIVVDGESIRFDPTALLTQEVQQSLEQRITDAERVEFLEWELIVSLPDAARSIMLGYATQDGPRQRLFNVPGHQQHYEDAFDATVALPLNHQNLNGCARLTTFAIAAASRCHPEMRMQAARRIREWQRSCGLEAESVASIARMIRGETTTNDANSRDSPQEAANLVLAALQEIRANRGEDTTLSPPVRFFNGDFYTWTGATWNKTEHFDLTSTRILQQALPSKDLTTTFIASVVQNIKALTLLDAGQARLPIWVQKEEPRITSVQWLALANGTIEIGYSEPGAQPLVLRQHDPRVFGATVLPYAFDASATCPLWQQTLQEIFPPLSDGDRRQHILQEFFGYCLLPWNHSLEQFVILLGLGANGKSVILAVLRHVLGAENVSHVPLDALSSEFRAGDMAGKLSNIAAEMQRMQRVQEGLLKQLISGEPTQVNRKHKAPITIYPSAKLVFATNYLPPFADTSDGIWRRMCVIPLHERFDAGRRDLRRADRLREELPGIFNWALEGSQRLLQQDAFTTCEICDQACSEHRHDSDPFRQFIDECCDVTEGAIVPVDELYFTYKEFCEQSGKKSKAKSEFGKQMRTLQGVQRQRGTTERRVYEYCGIAIRPGVLDRNPTRYRIPRTRPQIGPC